MCWWLCRSKTGIDDPTTVLIFIFLCFSPVLLLIVMCGDSYINLNDVNGDATVNNYDTMLVKLGFV